MIFCGQCGLQLTSNVTQCPRCGAAIDTGANQEGNVHVDDPTVASPSLLGQLRNHPSQPGTQGQFTPPGQRLILRPGSGSEHDYGTQEAFGVTSQVPNPISNVPYNPNYVPQSDSNYQGMYTQHNFTNGGGYAPQNPSLSGFATPGAANYAQQQMLQEQMRQEQLRQEQLQREQAAEQSISRGKATGLIIILIGLLCLLSAVVLAVMQHNGAFGSINHPVESIMASISTMLHTQALAAPLAKHAQQARVTYWITGHPS